MSAVNREELESTIPDAFDEMREALIGQITGYVLALLDRSEEALRAQQPYVQACSDCAIGHGDERR